MDTSKTYIKMSNHPLIQGKWKPKEGDCFSFVGDVHILADYEIDALNKRETDVDCYNEVVKLMGGHFVDHWNECRDGFVWLPYQDQIQEMIQPFRHYDHPSTMATDFGLFCDNKEMYEGIYAKKGYGFINKFSSLEQLWLAFYMYEKHKLMWDGEKWTCDCGSTHLFMLMIDKDGKPSLLMFADDNETITVEELDFIIKKLQGFRRRKIKWKKKSLKKS